MNNKELRLKYGDHTESGVYTYPPHFFAIRDHFTTNITNWKGFLTKFVDQPNLNFLEIGTGSGRSAVWMLENVLTDPSSKLITVDIKDKHFYKKESQYTAFNLEEDIEVSIVENLQPYIDKNKCKFIVQDSKLFFKNLNEFEKYDFIYLDGNHDPDYVIYEACLSFDLLKKNGYLLFDDYGWGKCRYGIESFLSCFEGKYELLYKEWQVLVEKL